MEKDAIIKAGIEVLRSKIKQNEEILNATQRDVNEAPSAMESHSDTSRYQFAILAQNQGAIINKFTEALYELEKFLENLPAQENKEIGYGSVVEIETDGKVSNYMLIPCEGLGGIEVQSDDKTYTLLSSDSPMATALKQKKVGDKFSLATGTKTKELRILSVA